MAKMLVLDAPSTTVSISLKISSLKDKKVGSKSEVTLALNESRMNEEEVGKVLDEYFAIMKKELIPIPVILDNS